MQTRKLGRAGLTVSAIGYGCMGAEALDAKAVDWMEPVTDAQYLADPVQTQ